MNRISYYILVWNDLLWIKYVFVEFAMFWNFKKYKNESHRKVEGRRKVRGLKKINSY